MALNIGLHEAIRLNPQKLFVEGDSTYVIQWAFQSSSYPSYLADIIEEVNISFTHIK